MFRMPREFKHYILFYLSLIDHNEEYHIRRMDGRMVNQLPSGQSKTSTARQKIRLPARQEFFLWMAIVLITPPNSFHLLKLTTSSYSAIHLTAYMHPKACWLTMQHLLWCCWHCCQWLHFFCSGHKVILLELVGEHQGKGEHSELVRQSADEHHALQPSVQILEGEWCQAKIVDEIDGLRHRMDATLEHFIYQSWVVLCTWKQCYVSAFESKVSKYMVIIVEDQ